jgi:hypothetical protein
VAVRTRKTLISNQGAYGHKGRALQ